MPSQFDRLAIMYLGDNEVWRTSTAEPTTDGIVWSYVKEMQQYNALWQQPQTLIFDLGNTVDSTYTAPYNTTLTATFFTVPNSPPTADRVLAISHRLGASGNASVFQVPSDNASVAYSFPRTVERAVVSLSACGQIDEEFWYSNVFDSDVATFGSSDTLLGGGPWREIQLLIDGQLAGVSWPFPVIFTGGVVPGFWRPIVSIEAYDLREHEIDITPWLGQLLDGKQHSFEIRVAAVGAWDGHGGAVAEPVGSYWLVTGKIFLFLNQAGHATVASKPNVSVSGPSLRVSREVTKTANGKLNSTLLETTGASRDISISATVNGRHTSWTQHLQYSNRNFLAANGTMQNTTQSTTGSDASDGYFSAYSYPITVNQQYGLDAKGNLTRIDGSLSTGLDLSVLGSSVFPSGVQPFNRTGVSTGPGAPQTPGQQQQPLLIPDTYPPTSTPLSLPSNLPSFNGAVLNTTQSGSATYIVTSNGTSSQSFSFGDTSQHLTFAGTSGQDGTAGQVAELYQRSVRAVNTTVVADRSVLLGVVSNGPTAEAGAVGVERAGVARVVPAGGGR
jgi:Peptide N-acetyl-beta-D-glucosaminyl asparaginase amidase A